MFNSEIKISEQISPLWRVLVLQDEGYVGIWVLRSRRDGWQIGLDGCRGSFNCISFSHPCDGMDRDKYWKSNITLIISAELDRKRYHRIQEQHSQDLISKRI